jgi:hypothetical protein
MPKSRRSRDWRPRRRIPLPKPPAPIHLDTFTLKDVLDGKRRQEEFKRLYWDWFNELAYQRFRIFGELKTALVEAAVGPEEFSNYYRSVTYKWSHDPLSVRGSVLNDAGGRFNFGDIARIQYPPFPCLYLGSDKMTSLQELFQVPPSGREGLTSSELALSNPSSETSVVVYGSLGTVIDLNQPDRLKDFVNLIKDFKITEPVIKEGRRLGVDVTPVGTVQGLIIALLYPNWRAYPMHVDVPASCQIFGQLVSEAGIEGIKYPSKYGGKDCLAVFPQNFSGTDSFVQLKDQAPPGVTRIRLDSKSCDEL